MTELNRRKVFRIMLPVLLIFVAICMMLIGLLLLWRPGQPQVFKAEKSDPSLPGSISEKISIEINGVKQGMFIKSKNDQNPVLLFVHGGPGMPEYWLTERYPTGLEDHFTVVWWEQRGAGLSFHADIPPETMTVEQFISDTLAVTRYLLDRFGQEKIYLMGHSWGSYIGIQAAAQAPELYQAYIGIGQMVDQMASEQLAYAYALTHFTASGDMRMVRRLEAAPPGLTVPLPDDYMRLRDDYMHRAGVGTTREMKSVIIGIFLPSWRFREYTLMEKVNLWRGKTHSRASGLWDTMLMTDMTQQVPELAIPVYFLHGRYDCTCAYPLALAYYKQINAPLKGFYTFEDAAHSPVFEDPQRMQAILLSDVLNGKNALMDTLSVE